MKLVTSLHAAVALVVLLYTPMSASGAELLGLYTFEGVSPAAFNDVSGKGLDPTAVGTGTLVASGYEGQAVSFSGSHTPIAVPIDISPGVTPSLTIGAWVKPNAIGQHGVWGHDNGGWDRGLAAGGNSGGNWRPVGDGGGEVNSGIPVSVGAWQFVAVSYDYAVEHKFYKDTSTYSRATASTGTGDTSMGIGALNKGGTWKYDGLVDNFFIFSSVLNEAEIAQIRANGLSGIQDVAAGLPPVSIDVVGDGSDYDEIGMQGWRSTDVAKRYDVDKDNVYGTAGLYSLGSTNFPTPADDATFQNFTKVGATWVTVSPGGDAPSYRNPSPAWNYADIDDPLATPGVSVANWAIQSGFTLSDTAGAAGDWFELLKFAVDDTAPQAFRLGVMAANFDKDVFHPTGLRIVADSGTAFEVTASVTNLTTAPARLTGMVFFDVNLNGRSAATFSVFSQRPATQGASLAGLTFDETPPRGMVFIVR